EPLDPDTKRLHERASSSEFRASQRAIALWRIRLEAIILVSVAHRSTGRSLSFFEECLYRLRYSSASIIALCIRAFAMASMALMHRRPKAVRILCNRLSDALDLFELR